MIQKHTYAFAINYTMSREFYFGIISNKCCKYLSWGETFCRFEMHERAANQGIGNQGESPSLPFTVKINIWAGVGQQERSAISMNTQS